MFDKIKPIAAAFVSGATMVAAAYSFWIMDPEQTRRWFFHPDSNAEKFERAMSTSTEDVEGLRAEVQRLKEKDVSTGRELGRLYAEIKVLTKRNEELRGRTESSSYRDGASRGQKKSPNLSGRSVDIYFSDFSAERAIKLKDALKKLGAVVVLQKEYASAQRSHILYYSNKDFIELALQLKVYLAPKFGFTKIENVTWSTNKGDSFSVFLP